MNKTIASLIFGLGLFGSAVAESETPANEPAATAAPAAPDVKTPAPAEAQHGSKLKKLSEELGLSEKQEDKIKSLFKKHKQKIKEIRQEGQEEIADTLTPTQKLKLYQLKEKNAEKIKALKQAVKDGDSHP